VKILLIEINATIRPGESEIERMFDVSTAEVDLLPEIGEAFSPMLSHGNRLRFECRRVETGPVTLNKVESHVAVVFGKHLLS
jgi:hypothetical protein